MKVQCQVCKDMFDDGVDPEGVLVPYIGLPQVTCPKCVIHLRRELDGMSSQRKIGELDESRQNQET